MDTSKLEEQLKSLTGNDFAELEQEERLGGNIMPMIQFSTSFQARLAARALSVNPHELRDLPMNEYVKIATRVNNFLLSTSEGDTTDKRISKK